MKDLKQLVPVWALAYRRNWLAGDLTAGLIVTVMLIPQSLAYALLAGLPAQVGLYASILPLIAYALLGSSMTLSVGPVAVASLMTVSALQPLAIAGSPEYLGLAIALALISGLMLMALGLLRMGFLAHLLSHPVISGFISGSAVLIALGQFKHVFGLSFQGSDLTDILIGLFSNLPDLNPATTTIGVSVLALLWAARRLLPAWLVRLGLSNGSADLAAKLFPMLAVIASTALVGLTDLASTAGVKVVGFVPQGLPAVSLPSGIPAGIGQLWLPALLISLVGFVESVSVGQTLAQKRRQRIDPNRELLGLGAANLASGLSGGYPVTGGFARSVVNFSAGANTPLAGVVAACLMALVIAAMTGLFYHLPLAVLSATIIVAVSGLIDLQSFKRVWSYDRGDALCLMATFAGVLLAGVEQGILLGISFSLAVLVWRHSHPHIAVIGRVGTTEHFRNVERHTVQTRAGLIGLRVDESLFFANVSGIERVIEREIARQPELSRFLLIMSAVNRIDSTALDMLTDLDRSLAERGVVLMLAEVKGPVMDRLRGTEFGERIRDRVFMSTHDAFVACHEDLAAPDPPDASAPVQSR